MFNNELGGDRSKIMTALAAGLFVAGVAHACNPQQLELDQPSAPFLREENPVDPEVENARKKMTALLRLLMFVQEPPEDEDPFEISTDEYGYVDPRYDVMAGLQKCITFDPDIHCVPSDANMYGFYSFNCTNSQSPDAWPTRIQFSSHFSAGSEVTIGGMGSASPALDEFTYPIPGMGANFFDPNSFKTTPADLHSMMEEVCTSAQEAIKQNYADETLMGYYETRGQAAANAERNYRISQVDLMGETVETIADNIEYLGFNYEYDGVEFKVETETGEKCTVKPRASSTRFDYYKDVHISLNCVEMGEDGQYTSYEDQSWLEQNLEVGL